MANFASTWSEKKYPSFLIKTTVLSITFGSIWILVIVAGFPGHAQMGSGVPQATFASIFTPENAYGPLTEPAPAHRRASPAEFEKAVLNGEMMLSNPARTASEYERLRQDDARYEGLARDYFGRIRPTLLERIMRVPAGYERSIEYTTTNQRKKTVLLRAQHALLREMVDGWMTFRSKSQQINLYAALKERLKSAPNIPPIDPDRMEWPEISLVNQQLIALLDAYEGKDASGTAAPSSYGKCVAEEGAGPVGEANEGDQTGLRCEPSPDGFLAKSDWALKWANTCVRNQGKRGTSSVFALTAALESSIARRFRRYANLSEQHFFSQVKLIYYPTLPDFGEGLDTLLSAAGHSKLPNYRLHFEDSWTYNPAYFRQDVTTDKLGYQGSCENYQGRYCSDSNHQGRLTCTDVDSVRYCGYSAPMPTATDYRIRSLAPLLDLLNPETALHNTRSLLRSGIPVVMSFAVTEPLMATGPLGYMATAGEETPVLGGQSILLSGWIPNSRRPNGLPEASGGGYFAAKNSWGRCTGDAGYFFLAYDWVREHALTLTAVFD